MTKLSGSLGWVAAVLLTLLAVAAALPGPYAGFALEDSRRPVYRGQARYKRIFNNLEVGRDMDSGVVVESLAIRLDKTRRKNDDVSGKTILNPAQTDGKGKQVAKFESADSNGNWSLVSFVSSITDHDHTRGLVTNFLNKSLHHLKTPSFYKSNNNPNLKQEESLDNLILSHTQHGSKPIQMYPEGSPPNWIGGVENPSVILIEDVHPSKLPKPTTNEVWSSTSHAPKIPPYLSSQYKPVQLFPKPIEQVHKKPVIKPVSYWDNHSPGLSVNSINQGPNSGIQVFLQTKPSDKTKPSYGPTKVHSVTVNPSSHNHNGKWNDSLVYKPPYNLVRPTRPAYYDPDTQDPPGVPMYKPVHTFTKPVHHAEIKPPHSSPRPPENNYKDPNTFYIDSHQPTVVIAPEIVLPVTETTVRPPPPTIIVLDSVTDTSTAHAPPNCGNVQVINHISKEPYGGCSDVMVFVNAPSVNSASSSAAGSNGGAAAAVAGAGAAGVASAGAAGAASAVAAGAASAASVGAPTQGTSVAAPPTTREIKSDAEVIVKSDISVLDGRSSGVSSTFAPTTATPIAESLKMVTKQLLQAPSATDMVATDVRTPPKVKSQLKGEITDFVPLGKGEAHPVIIDDGSLYEVITSAPSRQSTSPSSPGLSTWILLTNGEQSTLATKKKVTAQSTVDPKKKPVQITTPMPDKSIKKNEETKTSKPGIVKPVSAPVKKANITRQEPPKASPLILQDSKFKNRTPVVVGKIPAIDKADSSNLVKKVTTSPEPTSTAATIVTKKKIAPSGSKHTLDIVPTTSLLLETSTLEAAEETSTTETTTSTTKRPRRPSNKKKKKNKNRRRRPSKTEGETAETKVEDALESKIETNRPMSTRIYNYLAREVMPSVGVGIVGLVLTAGLAGLFLYPFGGGIARRNYDKGSNPLSESHMYYHNSYSPLQEPELSNVQPEEKIFGQVLSNVNQNSFSPSPSFEGTKYTSTNNHKYRYDLPDYNVNGYAGSNDYSTLPDSVKNGDYQTSDTSKYYSMDPLSTHYRLTDNSVPDTYKSEMNHYPSLTEYASYTNAASVGTPNSYETASDSKSNDTTVSEDKSDKSQPQFSALVGSPSFTNSDFVGTVSLTGSYGAQEVRHRTGVLAASDHGPRSIKRSKRDVHDDFNNEIDSTDEKLLRKPIPTPDATTTRLPQSSVESTTDTGAVNKESTTVTNESSTGDNLETTTDTLFNGADDIDDDDKDPSETPGTGTFGSDGGFFGFLKRVAQVKLKMGIGLLKSTGDALQRYLNTMAKRMEYVVRTMESNRRSISYDRFTSISSSRQAQKQKNE